MLHFVAHHRFDHYVVGSPCSMVFFYVQSESSIIKFLPTLALDPHFTIGAAFVPIVVV